MRVKLVKQRHSKDCFTAVLSSLLDIEYENIPKFYKLFPSKDDMPSESDNATDEFRIQFDSWLKSHGYYRVLFDVKYNEESKKVDMPYCSLDVYYCVGILRKPERTYDHAVVLHVTQEDITILDPKNGSDYEISDIIGIEIITKI